MADGINSAFIWLKYGVSSLLSLTLTLLTWRIWLSPNNASRWQMGVNSAFIWLKYGVVLFSFFNPYPANVENMVIS